MGHISVIDLIILSHLDSLVLNYISSAQEHFQMSVWKKTTVSLFYLVM